MQRANRHATASHRRRISPGRHATDAAAAADIDLHYRHIIVLIMTSHGDCITMARDDADQSQPGLRHFHVLFTRRNFFPLRIAAKRYRQ